MSIISQYRLSDWLLLFGLDPEEITRLQVRLKSRRSILLETSFIDRRAAIPSFRDRSLLSATPAPAPLPLLLRSDGMRRFSSWAADNVTPLYMKLGERDTIAFPDLLPGSIVRVQPQFDQSCLPQRRGEVSKRIFLVEHGSCLVCCSLRLTNDGRLLPTVTWERFAESDWGLRDMSSIRGVADLEIRSLLGTKLPSALFHLSGCWRPHGLVSGLRVSRLLRSAREQLDLSLREASGVAEQIARLMNDPAYFISVSSLSDYEAQDTLPRHLPKLLTLCAAYGLRLSALLRAAGLTRESAATHAIPEDLMPGPPAGLDSDRRGLPDAAFSSYLASELGAVPFLLRRSLSSLSGLASPVLQDFFWVGGGTRLLHPYLFGGLLIAVNRHKKIPRYAIEKSLWEQPLYLLRMRDGDLVGGCCGLENDALLLHSFVDHLHSSTRLQNQSDAEVVGQIVAIVRRLH